MRLAQAGGELLVEGVRIRHDHDRSAVRLGRVEPVDAEEMDLQVFAGTTAYGFGRTWRYVRREADRLVEGDRSSRSRQGRHG